MASEEVESSVFLSPPLSEESTISNKIISRIRRYDDIIPFNLDEEDYNGSKCDILKESSKLNLVKVVISKILDQLSEKDLLRASQVSKEWRRIIKLEHMKSGRRLSRYVNRCKKIYVCNKENSLVGVKSLVTSPVTLKNMSTPIPAPLGQKNDKVNVLTPADEKTPIVSVKASSSNYKQCPGCQSPARTTFKQVGHCTKCKKDFCIRCFYPNSEHSPTCKVVGGSGVSGNMTRKLDQKTPKRYSLGSSGNKARLKRL